MTNSRKFISYMVVAVLILLIGHFVLHFTGYLSSPAILYQLIVGSILFLFIGGAFLIGPGLHKAPENFVGRFMILTTVQMLTILSIIAAVVYKNYSGLKSFGFQLISIFIALLFLQSFLLIRLNKNR